VKKLSSDQRRALSEFLANLAVAWLAAGIIAPTIEKKNLLEAIQSAIMPVLWAGFSLLAMLSLTKGERK